MKLYHREDLIGIITNPTVEGLWMLGDLELTPAAEQYKELFAFLTDDDRAMEEPPFSEDVVNDWYIEDEKGERKPVFVPAVHDDGTSIAWRW